MTKQLDNRNDFSALIYSMQTANGPGLVATSAKGQEEVQIQQPLSIVI